MLIKMNNEQIEPTLIEIVNSSLRLIKSQIKTGRRKLKLKMIICKKDPYDHKFSFEKI